MVRPEEGKFGLTTSIALVERDFVGPEFVNSINGAALIAPGAAESEATAADVGYCSIHCAAVQNGRASCELAPCHSQVESKHSPGRGIRVATG